MEDRVAIFIDGSNFYHGIREILGRVNIDYNCMIHKLLRGRELVREYYYIPDPENPDAFMINKRTSIGVYKTSSTGITPCIFLEYDASGLLKRREDPIDAPDESPARHWPHNLVDEKQYSNSYDSEGNLVTETKYFVRDDGTATDYYKIVTTTRNSFGAVLSQKTQTQETIEYDRFNYNVFRKIKDRDEGNYIGGGGYTDYSYLYEDSRFPLLPTTIYEDFDDDGNGEYDRSQRKTTRAYDSRGNLVEQKVYVDDTYYVATVWEYHPIYNFPTKKTTWQGYCHDDANGDIVSDYNVLVNEIRTGFVRIAGFDPKLEGASGEGVLVYVKFSVKTSGKSNISDALCFVLGRLSIKSMRAAKSQNLIFLGTKNAAPAKEASVELIFNNSNNVFSLDKNENATRYFGKIEALDNVGIDYILRVDANAVEGWNTIKIGYKTGESKAWIEKRKQSRLPSKTMCLLFRTVKGNGQCY